MSELAAAGARIRVPVAVTCRVLKLHRQHYYAWLADPVTGAEWTLAHRANAIFDAHRDVPEFGYRFLLDEARDAGQAMAERTAWRICADNGWWSALRQEEAILQGPRRRTGPRRSRAPRVQRAGGESVGLSDLTEHPTKEGKNAVSLLDQGRHPVTPDRGLLDQRPDDLPDRRRGPRLDRRPSRVHGPKQYKMRA